MFRSEVYISSETNVEATDCCTAADCNKERVYAGDMDLKYCSKHRCNQDGCDGIKVSGNTYCETHTCEAADCLAWVPGGGPGDASRYCERHRICQHVDCNRFAFTRENGQGCMHCGAHYCHFAGCEEPRDRSGGGEYCQTHTCADEGCSKGRARENGFFCKSHECARAGCQFRAWLGQWCAQHQCARPGCKDEAAANHYCSKHLVCPVDSCGRFRLIEGGVVRGACEDREFDQAVIPDS